MNSKSRAKTQLTLYSDIAAHHRAKQAANRQSQTSAAVLASSRSIPLNKRLKLTSCTILKNGHLARSTKDKFSCGTGILPVHKRLINKGAISKLKQTLLLFCGHSNPRIRYLQINPIAAICWESESRPTAPFHLR